jgi:hypothetical protein
MACKKIVHEAKIIALRLAHTSGALATGVSGCTIKVAARRNVQRNDLIFLLGGSPLVVE